jgi:hypothetical protein
MVTWPLTVWPKQRWHFLWRCMGILACIALALLPALSCPCCWRCTGNVAEFAFKGPADTALAFAGVALASSPASCWCHCQHHAVVSAASIAPTLLPFLPSLRAPCGGVRPSAVIVLRGVLTVSGVVNAYPLFFVAWRPCGNARAFLQRCHCRSISRQLPPCPCSRHCADVVAELDFGGPANAALAFAGVALASLPASH